IIMAHPHPPNHADDLPEVVPAQPELSPAMLEPTPFIPEHVLFDEDEDPEEDPEEEPQEEEEEFEGYEFEKEGMDINDDDEMDDPEVIHPYEIREGALPPPPAESDSSSDVETEVDVATIGTISRLLPVVRKFTGRMFIRGGSSFAAPTADDYVEFTPGYTDKDVDLLHHQV
ncbi:hypothetical protein Tco_0181240, partial [Tanacetum coccineum]